MSLVCLPEVLDEQSLRALEYPRLLELISRHVISTPARAVVLSLRPLSDREEILRRQNLIKELLGIVYSGHCLPIEHFEDLEGLFRRVVPQDAVLMPEELLGLAPFVSSVIDVQSLGRGLSEGPLRDFIAGLNGHPDLLYEIRRCINPDGSISDEASVVLKDIRTKIKTLRNKIKRLLERMIQDPDINHHLQDIYITERNGRYVIPVKADHKGHIKGVIHDVSNTEATVFVEPAETVALGNELENLVAEEKMEQWRILKRLSALVREYVDELVQDYHSLVFLDALWAVARFSEQMRMVIPEIADCPEVVIRQGRHPILWHVLRETGREEELVPLEFEIGRNFRCLVITGSNTGGKTVALKTVGLLVSMALTGMPVPAAEGSRFFIFRKIMADIGDEQSIESSLSTFSAHLLRMKSMLEETDNRTLVLIDELGTGTDPEEGGALGASFVEGFLEKGGLVVVTTHLTFLKAFAQGHPEMENAAMLVETEVVNGQTRVRPTYRLSIGQAGQSRALQIAEALGAPEEVLKRARGYLQDKGNIIEEAMREVAALRLRLEERLKDVEQNMAEIKQLRQSLRDEIEQIKQRRQKYYKEARLKALEVLEKAKAQAQQYLDTLKGASKTEAKKTLKALSKEITEIENALAGESAPLSPEDIKEGMYVRIGLQGPEGQIIRMEHDRVVVSVRGLPVETSMDNLYPAELKSQLEPPSISPGTEAPGGGIIKIDIRGQTAEEAIREVDRALNRAVLDGVSEIYIIHGVGKGVLKAEVRRFLERHPLVDSYRSGTAEEGGDGVTVVTLK